MRIVVFTVENIEFVPLVLDPLLDRYASDVVRVFISRSLLSWAFLRKRLRFFVRNRYPFCIRPGDLFRYCRSKVIRRGSHRTVLDYLEHRGVQAEYIEEIRTQAIRQRLRDLRPDLFLFLPFDKIAGAEFLSIPALGTFNLHMGKLPEHRGGLSAFWVLRFGDKEAGATLHRAVLKLDGGEIVGEVRLPVETRSMKKLMTQTFRAAGQMVADSIDRLEAGTWTAIDSRGRPEGYYLLPSRDDFREFYRRGCRLI